MNIALCLIATGRYVRFLAPLLESARRFFLPAERREYFVFSDRPTGDPAVRWFPVAHEPWPGPTLHRYQTMLLAAAELALCDYVFYCDVDMRFEAPVDCEVLGPGLTAVLHPGFCGKPREAFTYETRSQSTACIPSGCGTAYYAGGFQGGATRAFLQAMRTMRANIGLDAGRHVTAVWHDESHWNRYLVEHPPAVVLPPLYCSPESWHVAGRKLVALDKNHAEMRS